MKVVVNTSPIIFLSKLNALDLLVDLFPEVLIPRAVIKEVGDIQVPDKAQVLNVSLSGRKFVLGAMGRLHEGELEFIVLVLERNADGGPEKSQAHGVAGDGYHRIDIGGFPETKGY